MRGLDRAVIEPSSAWRTALRLRTVFHNRLTSRPSQFGENKLAIPYGRFMILIAPFRHLVRPCGRVPSGGAHRALRFRSNAALRPIAMTDDPLTTIRPLARPCLGQRVRLLFL
jgi:hypothetical protein